VYPSIFVLVLSVVHLAVVVKAPVVASNSVVPRGRCLIVVVLVLSSFRFRAVVWTPVVVSTCRLLEFYYSMLLLLRFTSLVNFSLPPLQLLPRFRFPSSSLILLT
jgi:hypothetical protein